MDLRNFHGWKDTGRTLRRALAAALLMMCSGPVVRAAEPTTPPAYLLQEPAGQSRVLQVQQTMQLTGTLKTPTPEGKSISLKMKATTVHEFLQRRLSGRGRDARALRAARFYRQAHTSITVGKTVQEKKLSPGRTPAGQRLIVVQGDEEGLVAWSPDDLLEQTELEVLSMPGDILAVHGLLPDEKVMTGQKWTPPVWAVLLLSGIDAAAECNVTCRLESVEKGTATVRFEGIVKGARDGAPTEVQLRGSYRFDLSQRLLVSAELEQREKTEAGAVSPALDVKAIVSVRCRPAEDVGPLTSQRLSRLPLEPEPSRLKALFPLSGDVSFVLDRHWHVVYHRAGFAILRLLANGNLIAQVNIKLLPPAEAGQHVSEEQFQNDIRRELGPRLTALLKAERIRRPSASSERKEQMYRFRVVAAGKANGVEMRWIYYLCAAPDGRQVSLVFAVEKKLQQQLADHDLAFVLGLRFAPQTTE